MAPAKPAAKGKLLGLNKWAWIGIVALGVAIFWYVRKQGNGTPKAAQASPTDALPDATAQDTAALGGTPADSSAYDNIAGLLDWQTQSLEDFFSPYLSGGLASGGVGSVGGVSAGGVAGGGTAAGASSDPTQTTFASTTDVANQETMFTPAPAPAPGQSVGSLSAMGVQITPGTIVTAPNAGAGAGNVSSGIAGLGGAAGGQYVAVPSTSGNPTPSHAVAV